MNMQSDEGVEPSFLSERRSLSRRLSVCRQVLESFKIMDYSLLLGIHVLDRKPLSRGSRCDSKRGQKVLYSTALESIQGNLKDPEPVTDDDTYVDGFKDSSPTSLAFCHLLFTTLGFIFLREEFFKTNYFWFLDEYGIT